MNYWLMKTEPTTFGIDHLAKAPNKTTAWDGVRNYQARNMLRDQMKKGDQAFFYHSNCDLPGIVGIIEIVKEGYVDHTAFDPDDHHYDPKSTREKPLWYMVDVKLIKKFSRVISLAELRQTAGLKNMIILRKGNRLSVTPVTKEEWQIVNKVV